MLLVVLLPTREVYLEDINLIVVKGTVYGPIDMPNIL